MLNSGASLAGKSLDLKDFARGDAMNRPVLFDSPFLLGFEHTRLLIERAAKAAAESYQATGTRPRDSVISGNL